MTDNEKKFRDLLEFFKGHGWIVEKSSIIKDKPIVIRRSPDYRERKEGLFGENRSSFVDSEYTIEAENEEYLALSPIGGSIHFILKYYFPREEHDCSYAGLRADNGFIYYKCMPIFEGKLAISWLHMMDKPDGFFSVGWNYSIVFNIEDGSLDVKFLDKSFRILKSIDYMDPDPNIGREEPKTEEDNQNKGIEPSEETN